MHSSSQVISVEQLAGNRFLGFCEKCGWPIGSGRFVIQVTIGEEDYLLAHSITCCGQQCTVPLFFRAEEYARAILEQTVLLHKPDAHSQVALPSENLNHFVRTI